MQLDPKKINFGTLTLNAALNRFCWILKFVSKNSTGSGGLSETTANTLYLRKTTTDTATALETFSGGISTNSIKDLLMLITVQEGVRP